MTSSRPILVGMNNPYGADPAMALYPLPERASGGRLARILGLPGDVRVDKELPWSKVPRS